MVCDRLPSGGSRRQSATRSTDRRGQDLSGSEILTERLVLAPLGPVDVPRLFEHRSQAEVAQYQTWVPQSIDDARHFIADFGPVAFDAPGRWSQLGIRLRGTCHQ